MKITHIEQAGFERVWKAQDPEIGFTAFIALHDLTRGPALGGVRLWQYRDEASAIADALSLARAMTLKSAIAELPHGGGKGIIIKPPGDFDRQLFMDRFGIFIEYLQGQYITAKDVGTNSEDMAIIRNQTRYVTGLPEELGGAGDPSPLTAYGVYLGIRHCLREIFGSDLPSGKRLVLQGLGGVGEVLARLLYHDQAEVWGSDINLARLFKLAESGVVHPLLPELIFSTIGDVFIPCALGQSLDANNIPQLRVKIVAGCANDPLKNADQDAALLQQRNVLYAPDFVINSGGLIHVATEWAGYRADIVKEKTERIPQILQRIFTEAKEMNCSTHQAALRIAQANLHK